eukprot:EC788309.1.p2 GENE.EC788309.1~~EC788309.1.p2  ORF type:complete len:109 (-),score=8.02 EC788309.1:118-444(-)
MLSSHAIQGVNAGKEILLLDLAVVIRVEPLKLCQHRRRVRIKLAQRTFPFCWRYVWPREDGILQVPQQRFQVLEFQVSCSLWSYRFHSASTSASSNREFVSCIATAIF